MAAQLDILGQEATTDGRLMISTELARVVPVANASFAYAHIAQQHDFVIHSRFAIHFSFLNKGLISSRIAITASNQVASHTYA